MSTFCFCIEHAHFTSTRCHSLQFLLEEEMLLLQTCKMAF